jgi:hypothetical protein
MRKEVEIRIMKKRSMLLIAALAALGILFTAAGIYAGTQAKDKFGIETQGCESTKGAVEFDHKKHSEEYAKKFAEFYPNGCGECHHDDKGKPRKDLKAGMEVKKCFECHDKCGEKPKGKDAPKLSKAEEIKYIAEAYHDNCRGCHKDYDKKMKTKAAPTTCTKCHPKKK